MHANGITKTYMKSKVLATHASLKNSFSTFCLVSMQQDISLNGISADMAVQNSLLTSLILNDKFCIIF